MKDGVDDVTSQKARPEVTVKMLPVGHAGGVGGGGDGTGTDECQEAEAMELTSTYFIRDTDAEDGTRLWHVGVKMEGSNPELPWANHVLKIRSTE